jgi:drug/metabolite transporter (DMT)-like permease
VALETPPHRVLCGRKVVMAYLLAVAAAFSNAITTILQRMGVETAPADTTLRFSLIKYAIHRKVWIAGFVGMICGFLLQFLALHFGRLSQVQPILTLELPFLVAILGIWFGHRLGWHEWLGAVLAAGGLATFLGVAQPGGGEQHPDLGDWLLVSAIVVVTCLAAIGLAQVGPPAWRAAMFGVSAAVMFALTAAIIKQMNADIISGWGGVFVAWPPYALAASGLAAMFLAQNAYHAGPITASQSTLVLVDPLASIAIGIGLFGDQLQTGGARGPFEAIGLVVLALGVFWLARSPLVAGVKSEEDAEEHVLSTRPHGLSSKRRMGRRDAERKRRKAVDEGSASSAALDSPSAGSQSSAGGKR